MNFPIVAVVSPSMRRTLLALALATVCRAATGLAVPSSGQERADLSPEQVTRIEQAVTAAMSRLHVPAVSVAITRGDHIVWQYGFGMADLENFVPAKDTTVYRIASVSKPITAAAVMQLAEKGKIGLDAPIQQYVPAFPRKPFPIAVRNLLTHTSGIRHWKDDEEFHTTRHCAELKEGLMMFQNDPLLQAPGEKFTYSTFGYVLLGLAVEQASGMRFIDYLRQNVFAPAGMRDTRQDTVTDIIPNRARGYGKTESGELRNARLVDTSCRLPGGGIVSTAPDMARFLIAMQSGALLKAQTVAEMVSNKVTAEQWERTLAGQPVPEGHTPPGIGLGWAIGTDACKAAIWHGGNQQGATSIIYLLAPEKLGIVILMNLEEQGDEIKKLADQVAGVLSPQ